MAGKVMGRKKMMDGKTRKKNNMSRRPIRIQKRKWKVMSI